MVKYIFPKSPLADIQKLYQNFNAPVCNVDCGEKCRVNNPNGVPYCCDITHAIPAVYDQEANYYQDRTKLWFPYMGESAGDDLSLPDGMRLYQCLGASKCQREYRSLSCRQFPFYPYVTADYAFLGLALEWEFKEKCWLFEHLELVTAEYREQFVHVYDEIFAFHQDIFENYAEHSARAREAHRLHNQKLFVLGRDGEGFWIDPSGIDSLT